MIHVLIFLILYRITDVFKIKDYALQHSQDQRKRMRYSRIWHASSWLMMAYVSIVLLLLSGFDEWLAVPLLAALSLVVMDILWNILYGVNLLYQGDGRGSFMEELAMKISERICLSYSHTSILLKLCLILTGTIIYLLRHTLLSLISSTYLFKTIQI